MNNKIISFLVWVTCTALGVRGASDPDLWWHLATGRLIATTGAIPRVDPFSWTHLGQPWVAHEWLTDWLMYQVYALAGLPGLMLFYGLVIGAAYWLMYQIAARYSVPLALAVTAWAGVVGIPAWGPRPQMFNLLFLALFIYILTDWMEKPEEYSPFVLTLLMVLWVNMHGGFVLGIVVVFIYLAAAYLYHGSQARNLAAAACLLMLAPAANPQGLKIYVYPFLTLGSEIMQSTILEWSSPNFHLVDYQVFPILIGMGVLAFIYSPNKPLVHEWLLFAGAAAAGLLSVRNIPLFTIVAIPIIVKYVRLALNDRFARKTARMPGEWQIAAVALVLFIAGWHIETVLHANRSPNHVPSQAVDYLEQMNLARRVFNEYQFGGYLVWRGLPVYIDGRADLYGDHLVEYLELSNGRDPLWRERFDQYGLNVALLYPDSPLANILLTSRQWVTLYQDDQAMVLGRVHQVTVNDGNIEWVWPGIFGGGR